MTATRPYLCQLIVNTWHNFRIAELRAAASVAGVALAIEPEEEAAVHEETVFLRVHAADDASVERIAARTVLARRFVELWASGDSWDALAEALRSMPREQCAPYLAEGTTFKVRVEAFGRSLSEAEKIEQIKRLEPLLPWRGKVRLKDPQHTFVLLYDGARGGHGPKAERLYFGRVVASGQRELPGKYDLKKRNYIGTTSLDAELSLVMANLAQVRTHDVVYDPYCGTASTLVAAAHFGARVVGSDLYVPVLKGKLRTRSGPSAKNQPAKQGIGETFAQYGLPPPLALVHADNDVDLPPFRVVPGGGGLFDAIITDPPYGVREMSAKLDDAPLTQRTLQPGHVDGHTPKRGQAELETVLRDLFGLATRQLADGGRLVLLLPCTVHLPTSLHLLPPHAALVIESLCEQRMAARWSRWCVAMRRLPRAEAPVPEGAWPPSAPPLWPRRSSPASAPRCSARPSSTVGDPFKHGG